MGDAAELRAGLGLSQNVQDLGTMADKNNAPVLVVAGGHDETSLGWAAADRWLARDPAHRVVLTVRSDKAYTTATKQDPERITVLRVDWAAPGAGEELRAQLEGRSVAGAIHAIAGAPQENFTEPAHAVDASVYLAAFDVTAVTLVRLVDACRPHFVRNAGVVTFGFGEFGVVAEEYGGALSVAKLALAQTVAALGVSLGRSDPPARTLEIVTGLIPTYGARGVAAGLSKRQGSRVSAAAMTDHFMAGAPLAGTDAAGQRTAAAELAVAFVADAMFAHTTGERIHVDGGWTTTSKGVAPS